MTSFLRTLAWVVAIVYATVPAYWLVVHSGARRWATRGGKRLTAIGPIWVLMWITAGALSWRWHALALYHTPWSWLPGALLIGAGFLLYGPGHNEFSTAQVLGRAELEPDRHEQRLVTTGIRARIRHPYYLAHLSELAGWTIGSGLLVCFALLVLAVITGYAMIQAEERELEQRFGESYRAYRARSSAMFPGLW